MDDRVRALEAAQRQMQDTLIVMAAIQERQAAVQKDQAERQALFEKNLFAMDERLKVATDRLAHLAITVDEIGDKLNGLIGYLDGQHGRPQ